MFHVKHGPFGVKAAREGRVGCRPSGATGRVDHNAMFHVKHSPTATRAAPDDAERGSASIAPANDRRLPHRARTSRRRLNASPMFHVKHRVARAARGGDVKTLHALLPRP